MPISLIKIIPPMELKRKTFPAYVLLMLSGPFVILECLSNPFLDATYNDLETINATCKGYSCADEELDEYSCNCDSPCSLLGNCCVDSPNKNEYPKQLKHVDCRTYNDGGIYYVPMIYDCDPDLENDKTTTELCKSKGELLNDPFLNIPVTDPETGISYKNYYCYACNENYGDEEPVLWNLIIESYYRRVNTRALPDLYFDKVRWLWIMDHNKPNATDVSLYTQIPEEIKDYIPYCYTVKMISECASNWTDDNVRSKCLGYMALARIKINGSSAIVYYRNPHCAICNYQTIDDLVCSSEFDDNWVVNDFFYGSFSARDKKSKFQDVVLHDRFIRDFRTVRRTKKENKN
ncbi:uncharacterized protein [Parasteatoda tepidariorum]|uniref:uncharacterized protein isoform X4 n=1 Tax=Parasteatoda tepidariorum TaxID=114398 RepID=UPI001C726607|nr:uncharacterized protein LOC107438329 isoform X2 [Parasteatoda tepidariorum]